MIISEVLILNLSNTDNMRWLMLGHLLPSKVDVPRDRIRFLPSEGSKDWSETMEYIANSPFRTQERPSPEVPLTLILSENQRLRCNFQRLENLIAVFMAQYKPFYGLQLQYPPNLIDIKQKSLDGFLKAGFVGVRDYGFVLTPEGAKQLKNLRSIKNVDSVPYKIRRKKGFYRVSQNLVSPSTWELEN